MKLLAALTLLTTTPTIFAGQSANATHDNTRIFAVGCEQVRPLLSPLLHREQFIVDLSVLDPRMIGLMYTGPETRGSRANKNVDARTLYHPSFFHSYSGFRIAGAAISLVDRENRCTATMVVNYEGLRSRGAEWRPLPSNGAMEQQILDDVANALFSPAARSRRADFDRGR